MFAGRVNSAQYGSPKVQIDAAYERLFVSSENRASSPTFTAFEDNNLAQTRPARVSSRAALCLQCNKHCHIWAGRFAYLAGVVQCYRGLELVSSSKELVFSAGDGLDLQVIERQNDHTVMVVAWW